MVEEREREKQRMDRQREEGRMQRIAAKDEAVDPNDPYAQFRKQRSKVYHGSGPNDRDRR